MCLLTLFKYYLAENRRPFGPSSGTSMSGMKDLFQDFDDALDHTEHVNRSDEGTVLPILVLNIPELSKIVIWFIHCSNMILQRIADLSAQTVARLHLV